MGGNVETDWDSVLEDSAETVKKPAEPETETVTQDAPAAPAPDAPTLSL